MRPFRTVALTLVALCAGLACGSEDATNPGNPVQVSGVVRDYFTGAPVGGALVAGGGQVGSTTAAGDGSFAFSSVPRNSGLQLSASLTGYRDTRNLSIAIGTTDVTADVELVASADLARQYAAVGLTQTSGTVAVFVDLEDDSGAPREGLPLSAITLIDTNDDPVGNGPYVFGAAGDIVPNATLAVTTAFAGRSRIAFLNVPAGRTTLRVQVTSPAPATLTFPVSGGSNGVTLGRR